MERLKEYNEKTELHKKEYLKKIKKDEKMVNTHKPEITHNVQVKNRSGSTFKRLYNNGLEIKKNNEEVYYIYLRLKRKWMKMKLKNILLHH